MATERFNRAAFGKRLRQALERSRLNQSGLARAIGQDRARVSDWITGRREPGIEVVIAIADELSVSLDWLLAGRESPMPERAVVDDLAELAPTLVDLASRARQLAGS